MTDLATAHPTHRRTWVVRVLRIAVWSRGETLVARNLPVEAIS